MNEEIDKEGDWMEAYEPAITAEGSASLSNDLLCGVCGGYNYELLGCCSGIECGCMGLPVDAKPCSKCNPDGKKEPSLQAKKDWPWFFMTEKEWNKYQEDRRAT